MQAKDSSAAGLKALVMKAIIPLLLSMLAPLVKEDPHLNQNDFCVSTRALSWLTSLENRALRQTSPRLEVAGVKGKGK